MMCQIDWKTTPEETVVCYCANINKQDIVSAIQSGANSIKQIHETTGACLGNRCKELNPLRRCCHPDIVELLNIYGNNPNISCDCCNAD